MQAVIVSGGEETPIKRFVAKLVGLFEECKKH